LHTSDHVIEKMADDREPPPMDDDEDIFGEKTNVTYHYRCHGVYLWINCSVQAGVTPVSYFVVQF